MNDSALEFSNPFISALPDPAMLIGAGMIVVSANEPMERLLEAKAAGRHLTSFYRAPVVLQAVKAALQSDEKSNVEHVARTSPPRTFDIHVAPLIYGNPQGRAALVLVRDRTLQQQIERMRSDFVANASHELRTPLATLTGFIETMQGAAKDDLAAHVKFLGLMKAQADRMARLTDDLLSLSRIEINEHHAPTEKVRIAALLRQCAGLLATAALAADCVVNIEADESISVTGDPYELQQVFQNLLENALKYGGMGKRVDVTAKRLANHADVTIRDYGAGIAAHHIPRLTERFYRVDVKESRTQGGTGLGLAIVKHILNRHRGKLAIESRLGKGSAFIVRLPST